MLNENLLWYRAIDPISGRLTRHHTILMSAIIIAGGAIIGATLAYAVILLFSFL